MGASGLFLGEGLRDERDVAVAFHQFEVIEGPQEAHFVALVQVGGIGVLEAVGVLPVVERQAEAVLQVEVCVVNGLVVIGEHVVDRVVGRPTAVDKALDGRRGVNVNGVVGGCVLHRAGYSIEPVRQIAVDLCAQLRDLGRVVQRFVLVVVGGLSRVQEVTAGEQSDCADEQYRYLYMFHNHLF